jgi:hypothetical protein
MTNIIYPDGSARFKSLSRVLQVPIEVAAQLIKSGMEFFYFEGGPFHVEYGVDVLDQLKDHVEQCKQKRRMPSKEKRLPTRVLRVLVVEPDGSQYEVDNLLNWLKQKFPSRYQTLYFAAMRNQICDGYKITRIGWVKTTVLGTSEFVQSKDKHNGKH